jgi:hypothetical protein
LAIVRSGKNETTGSSSDRSPCSAAIARTVGVTTFVTDASWWTLAPSYGNSVASRIRSPSWAMRMLCTGMPRPRTSRRASARTRASHP